MDLGYYHKKLTRHEIILPLVILCLIMFSVVQGAVLGVLSELSFLIINATAALLSVWFLFPRFFYIMKIDLGNYRNSLLWLIPLVIFAFGYSNALLPGNYLSITKLPLLLFTYHQVMRVLHLLVTKQQPSFGAIWFDKGNRDRYAKRRISTADILFNMLYAGIPMALVVFLIFYRQINP